MYWMIFIACSEIQNPIQEDFPMEEVECTHPDSRFEGVVIVEVEDSLEWQSIHFRLSQNGNDWDTSLQTEDGFYWTTRMQLYELDCRELYDYEVGYESW